MKELDQVLKDYLETPDTDYAIMVSGDWGCGKSYYISHTFMDQVTKIRVPNGEECYKPAYISLYGVSSVEDLEYRVFSGINQWTNNKLIRVIGTVGSKLLEAKGGSSSKKGIEAITFIDSSRVLIFDDLERICEDKIPVKEVLGIINTYSEHSHYKVIIVCNEKHFLADDTPETIKADYIKYKEKSVRFTYSFVSDINAIYDVMVSSLPANEYKDYLIKEKASILSIFKLGGDNNLRTLKFFIDTFDKVYTIAKETRYAPEVIRVYLVTYMLYLIENKQGHTTSELKSLYYDDYYDPKVSINKYSIYISDKYEPVFDDFKETELLVDYITTGYLDEHSMTEDVSWTNAEIEKQIDTPEGCAFDRLVKRNEMEDEEVISKINEVVQYVTMDKYDLTNLLKIYVVLKEFEHWKINGFKVTEEIDKVFIASMDRQKDIHIYDPKLGNNVTYNNLSSFTEEEKDHFLTIKEYALRINSEAGRRECLSEFDRVVEIVQNEDIEGLCQLKSDPEIIMPTAGFDWMRVLELLMTSSNPMAIELCDFIEFLFGHKESLTSYTIEQIKNEVLPALNLYLSSDDNRMRRIYISELQDQLQYTVTEYEKAATSKAAPRTS